VPQDNERPAQGKRQAGPKQTFQALAPGQPCKQGHPQWGCVAKQGGVGGAGVKQGRVPKRMVQSGQQAAQQRQEQPAHARAQGWLARLAGMAGKEGQQDESSQANPVKSRHRAGRSSPLDKQSRKAQTQDAASQRQVRQDSIRTKRFHTRWILSPKVLRGGEVINLLPRSDSG